MAGSGQPQVDYYFRRERLGDDGGERAHARIIGDLTEAKAGGLLCDFRVIEHAEAFPTQADERSALERLREFAMVKKIGLGRRFGSNGTHFGWFPARALLVSVGSELRNVFPCELENRYVEPEDFRKIRRASGSVGTVAPRWQIDARSAARTIRPRRGSAAIAAPRWEPPLSHRPIAPRFE